jgi:hypothetical protein
MSVLLRSLFILSVISLLIVGCGQKQAEQTDVVPGVVVNPVVEKSSVSVSSSPDASPATGGGYEPTPEERVPGVTLDAATVDAASSSASETISVATPTAK